MSTPMTMVMADAAVEEVEWISIRSTDRPRPRVRLLRGRPVDAIEVGTLPKVDAVPIDFDVEVF